MSSTARTPNPLFAQKHGLVISTLLGVALLLAIFASLCVGAYPMSLGHSIKLLLHLLWPFGSSLSQFSLKEIAVMRIIRPPRVLLATLAGIGLGLSGTALQGIMHNPLVSPDLVGVTSGAAFGGVAALALHLPPAGIFVLASLGGLVAITCTFSLVKLGHNNSSMMLILSGVFIGAFFLALVGLVEFLGLNSFIPSVVAWLLGSFIGADWTKVVIIGIPTLFGGAVLMSLRWRLNLLSLGDLDVKTLGVNARVLRWATIALVSFIVASQVAVSGVVAWVGLIIPHCARMLVGPDHRRLVPTAALLGALLVLGLDDFTRSIVNAEVPVGVLTAVIGTPVVCFLLFKSRGKGWGRA